ncbi:hypothetical protein CBG25_19950 [Arsenophonus sp. ENCA]|uniref:Sak single strand annealing protein n=1 Tax=Arsenophonus sp. ENCA TaxID=1987579 RepID=UPI000BCA50B1|nr:DUF1071 domain-containing protein [Arsenophonus sp. ENCA]PAU99508.1 hypothetical protein CBG25_19950 [Arsenophonus sp. ENCA]
MSKTQHTEKEKSFQQQVWGTLSAINVNEKIEKKNGLSYLSWAWAWGVLMAHYPESYYTIDTVNYNNDGSAMVSLTLTVKQGDNEFPRKMWLPVMDYRNQAISNPNAVDINKTLMRCLTKAISMFGLGFYIYAGEDFAGEDLPEQEKIVIQQEVAQQKARYDQLIRDLKTAAKRLSQKGWNFFFNNIPPCRFSLFLILVCTNNRLKIIHNIRATALDKL